MKLFLFVGSRRGYAVLQKLISVNADICGLLCLIEDPHEDQYHPKVTALAKEKNIPIFYSNEIKSADYAAVMQKLKPELAFAIGWRYLITKEAYSLPPKGTLIIHDSLLPKYRGFAPMNWAIINGEQETGVTLFHIAEGVDCGPIIDQRATPIHIEDTAKTVDERVIKLYEEIILKNLPALAAGTVTSKPQDESRASYTCKRTPEDSEINWQHSAETIHNLIRASTHPFPGAFTTLNGKRLYLWESELPKEQPEYVGRVPGRFLGKRDGAIEVLTGKGVLRLKRLQYAGEEEKAAPDFPASVKDTLGRLIDR